MLCKSGGLGSSPPHVSGQPFPGAARLLSVVSSIAVCVACTSAETSMMSPSASRCGVSVSNSTEMVPASGGAGALTISAPRDCTWAASDDATWVVITSAANGQGDGSVSYRVAANAEPATRRAKIDVNQTAATIVQE